MRPLKMLWRLNINIIILILVQGQPIILRWAVTTMISNNWTHIDSNIIWVLTNLQWTLLIGLESQRLRRKGGSQIRMRRYMNLLSKYIKCKRVRWLKKITTTTMNFLAINIIKHNTRVKEVLKTYFSPKGVVSYWVAQASEV